MNDVNSNADILGRMGEKIVCNWLRRKGCLVEEAIDHYDRHKDMIVDGKTAEVKTEQPFVFQNAFTFRESQLRKCKNVDILYFVSVPPVFRPDYEWGGWIFVAEPKEFTTRKYRTKQGLDMILVDIDQPALTPWVRMTDEEIGQLSKYAKSRY
jgi:hypothetical protein